MKSKKQKETKVKLRRDAKTGQFVTEQYVEQHPDTTVTESRKIKRKKK